MSKAQYEEVTDDDHFVDEPIDGTVHGQQRHSYSWLVYNILEYLAMNPTLRIVTILVAATLLFVTLRSSYRQWRRTTAWW